MFLCSERNHSKSPSLVRCKQRGNDIQCEKETRNDVMFGITVSSRASTNVTNYFHCGFVLILINVSQIKFRAWLALFRYGMLEVWPGLAFDALIFRKQKTNENPTSKAGIFATFLFWFQFKHYSNNYSSVLEGSRLFA